MKMARWAVLGGIMLVVAGCGMGGGDKPRIPCPNFLLLGHAENMTRFQAGPGRDITDIDFRAAITNFHGTCSQDADEVDAWVNRHLDSEAEPEDAEGDD